MTANAAGQFVVGRERGRRSLFVRDGLNVRGLNFVRRRRCGWGGHIGSRLNFARLDLARGLWLIGHDFKKSRSLKSPTLPLRLDHRRFVNEQRTGLQLRAVMVIVLIELVKLSRAREASHSR